jgi:hydrogenase small subunit
MSTRAVDGPAHLAEIPLPRTVSRRAFIGFCTTVAAALAVPEAIIARAVTDGRRLPVVWLGLQDCTGDTESFLRTVDPGIAALLFEVISLDYHESLMAPAGARTAAQLGTALAGKDYVCVVEGAIPTADGGTHCVLNGQSALELVRRVVPGALFTVAAGTCSVDGGIAAAAPNPTQAVGVATAVPDIGSWVALPGCPLNGVNLVATLTYYLANKQLPPLDTLNRPTFAYGQRVHGSGRCERFAHLRAGERVQAWGDDGHRNGWCLIDMGCHGPTTYANCYQRNWNSGSWPVGTGSICIGCTSNGFWDKNTPFFVHVASTPSPTATMTTSPSTSETLSPSATTSSSETASVTVTAAS